MRIIIEDGPTPEQTAADAEADETAQDRRDERFDRLLQTLLTVCLPMIEKAIHGSPYAPCPKGPPLSSVGARHVHGEPPDEEPDSGIFSERSFVDDPAADPDLHPRPPHTQERIGATYYDTLLSYDRPEIILATQKNLFAGENIGFGDLSNMLTGGCFVQGHFEMHRVRVKLWVEDEDGVNSSIYGLLETGLTFTVTVGNKIMQTFNAGPSTPESARVNSSEPTPDTVNLEFELDMAIDVEPRQNFAIEVRASPTLIKAMNDFPGKKFVRVYIDGILTRDIC